MVNSPILSRVTSLAPHMIAPVSVKKPWMIWVKSHMNSTSTRWRHQMETFSALLAFCTGNSPVTGEFPSQTPVTWNFDVFFQLCLNQQLSKQWRGWWFETPSRSLWRHCNDYYIAITKQTTRRTWDIFYLLIFFRPVCVTIQTFWSRISHCWYFLYGFRLHLQGLKNGPHRTHEISWSFLSEIYNVSCSKVAIRKTEMFLYRTKLGCCYCW